MLFGDAHASVLIIAADSQKISVSPPSPIHNRSISAPVECLGQARSACSAVPKTPSRSGPSQTVRVIDALLGVELSVRIHSDATFCELKQKLQSAQVGLKRDAQLAPCLQLGTEICAILQGAAGIRIIPYQYQRILVHG